MSGLGFHTPIGICLERLVTAEVGDNRVNPLTKNGFSCHQPPKGLVTGEARACVFSIRPALPLLILASGDRGAEAILATTKAEGPRCP